MSSNSPKQSKLYLNEPDAITIISPPTPPNTVVEMDKQEARLSEISLLSDSSQREQLGQTIINSLAQQINDAKITNDSLQIEASSPNTSLPKAATKLREADAERREAEQQKLLSKETSTDTETPRDHVKNNSSSVSENVNTIVSDLQETMKIIKEAAYKYRPIVHLHHREAYFPCTIGYYLKHCAVIDKMDNNKVVVKEGELTEVNIFQWVGSTRYSLVVNPVCFPGETQDKNQPKKLNDIPFYVHIAPQLNKEQSKYDKYQIIYMFLFCYNGPLYICNCGCLFSKACFCKCGVGAHAYDLEHITITVDALGNIIDGETYYAAHTGNQGQWLKKSNITWDADRPCVYMGAGSHASYNKPGIIWRCCSAINDLTSSTRVAEDPNKWNPSSIEYINETTMWNKFRGEMSQDGGWTPAQKEFWFHENGTSITKFKRFCCLC